MQLYQVTTMNDFGYYDRPVKDIQAVKLYYWHRGRNAWFGIWANHYFEGCMHTGIESAKRFVEAKRTQGSVFFVKELPAVLLITDGFSVAITQINCDHPLCDYTHYPVEEKTEESWRKDYGSDSAVLTCGAKLGLIMESFLPYSSYWIKSPPTKNSVIELFASVKAVRFEYLSNKDLMQWRSIPRGQGCRLGWSAPTPSGLNIKAVKNLIALVNNV